MSMIAHPKAAGSYDQYSSKASETAKKQRQRIERLKHTPLDPEKVEQALSDIGFGVDAKKFVEFLKDSMEEREYFKFEFTKSLSFIIQRYHRNNK